MPKNYTPPPRFKGQNQDRGYTDQQDKEKEKPISNQFPVRPNTKPVDTTEAWWNRD